jgi:hypothetical protein
VLAQESERFSGKVYGVVAFVVVFHLNKNIQDWGGVLDFWAWFVGSNPTKVVLAPISHFLFLEC